MLRKNRGITLIALVITVIILLILSAIVINTLIGENGILKQAVNSKNTSEHANLKELVDVAYTKYKTQLNPEHDLEYYLKKIDGATVEKIAQNMWEISKGNAKITISDKGEIDNGTIMAWSGSSPECPILKKEGNIWNWYIYTPEQLKFLSCFVNNGNNLTGTVDLTDKIISEGYNPSDFTMTTTTTIFLMRDLDLGARPTNDNWETEGNEAVKWTPIGVDATNVIGKLGMFEGNNHVIQGLYVNTTENFAGLFGNSNTVKNLTVKDSYVKGNSGVGGIIGVFREGEVSNCHNVNTIVIGLDRVTGGVTGQNTNKLSNCTNSGKVESKQVVGGIVGINGGEISNCTNMSQGSISGLAAVGGIVGSNNSLKEVSNSTNNGKISGTYMYIGGIVGFGNQSASSINSCINNGEVTCSNGYLGGIIGAQDSSDTITKCVNNGKIIGTGDIADSNECLGGIAGYSGAECQITECINNEEINANQKFVGGILGYTDTSNIINKCNNFANVNGNNKYVAGIIGSVQSSNEITECTNKGKITGKEYTVGGIVGALEVNSKIEQCINEGEINGSKNEVGGIIGWTRGTIIQCTNKGNVEGKTGNIGGVCGVLSGTLEKSVNAGNVTHKVGSGENLGGIVGGTSTNATIRIVNCYNTGKITEENNNTTGTGGIVGWISASGGSGQISNNYSIGTIDIKGSGCAGVGGVIGRHGGDAFTTKYNYYETGKANVTLNTYAQGLTADEMKTQNFVDQLNSEQNPAVWELGASNNGYPTLK